MPQFPLRVLVLSGVFLSASQGLALPVLVKGKNLSDLMGVSRDRLVGFSLNAGRFERVAVQVDEVEDDAFLVLRKPQTVMPIRASVNHPGDGDPFRGTLGAVHRVVIDSGSFRPCNEQCLARAEAGLNEVCGADGGFGQSLHKVTMAQGGGVVFLGECKRALAPLGDAGIVFDGKNQVSAPEYRATLSKLSPFLVDQLRPGSGEGEYLKSMKIHARLKTKLLVNINIDEEDLAGSITSVSRLPLATSLELAVQDKILGFSTGKQVCCDITYYRDAFYFPVLISPPEKIGSMRSGSFVALGFSTSFTVSKTVEKRETGASYVLLETGNRKLGISLRPSGKMRTYPSRTLSKGDEFKDYGLDGANAGLALDLSDKSGEQRFEAWFFLGDNEALLKEFAESGIKYSVSKLK